ncbi:MAG: hypothetical protein HQL05_13525 [Nitrospirae bacterium]|uniref:hypothetical protein n=1 Tax=Candidatus Magnetobacterium casense TaxID=1455061 RepID=UPI000591185C|nr:hypothetical protein [Candidatus Magnetobacterium casensis]MBF0338835.1 hypothetical protein [Nitrospirota bacterium]
MTSDTIKRLFKVIGKGLLTGFIGGLAIFFLMFPVGVLLHVAGLPILLEISRGGIHSLRTTLVSLQLLIALGGIVFFAWRDFGRGASARESHGH